MGDDSNPSLFDRIHSWAKVHASDRNADRESPTATTTPPPTNTTTHQPDGNGQSPTRSTASDDKPANNNASEHPEREQDAKSNSVADKRSSTLPPPAPPPQDAAVEDEKRAAVKETSSGSSDSVEEKPALSTRMIEGSKRFVQHTKDALFHSWINILLVFVPIGIAVNFAPLPHDSKPTIIFAMNAVAIVPLAGLLSHATESVASRMGDTWASLLNVTFGNAVELIIFIIALAKNEIRIVQASILGSILANLLLILGMAFLLGGLRFREQIYNSTVTQMSACLLSLSVISLLLPTAFHASFSNNDDADLKTLKISRGTSVVLLIVYVLYLLFQLKSHAYMYESTPQNIIDEESHPGVFADMMNSSSSDDTSSSDSSDSDGSSDSHDTRRKRFKRAIRHRKRRKSNASSFQTTSVPSILSSPSTDKTGGHEEQHDEGYFDFAKRQRTDSIVTGKGKKASTGVQDGQPRVRDFEPVQAGSADSIRFPEVEEKPKSKKKREKKSKKKRSVASIQEQREADPPTDSQAAVRTEATRQNTITNARPDESNAPSGTGLAAKRPAALRQFSIRPAIPSLLQNNVFVDPPTTANNTAAMTPLALTRSAGPKLRRTSSLPDRLNRQAQANRQVGVGYQDQNNRAAGQGVMFTPDQGGLDNYHEEDEEEPVMSRTAAVMLLLISTGLVAFCAELLVDAIPDMIQNTTVSQAFIGVIILPIVGNAAEHVTAVTVAAKNKMDLAIGVAVGSSIQIALFVTPFVVLLGWIMNKDMSLYFNLFETVSLFVTVFVVNFLVLDGRSNYLEGSLLIAAYVIIALAAFFYPNKQQLSTVGGGSA